MFEERHLNFNKFLDQRAEQISKFRDILKLQTKKKGHQALPKSIRRRAMSHNRYRIPSKMRKLNEEELIKNENMQRIPKCRKHIRKRSRLILSYKDRHSKIKWLSTHLWAAKRMKMIDYYGYKVAQTPNEKAFRSSYRHFMQNCCMIDLSYFQCLSINLDSANALIPSNIKVLLNKSDKLAESIHLNTLQSNRSYEGFLYNQNCQLVCPLIILKSMHKNNQTNKFSLKCFFNPCALEEVKQVFAESSQYEIQISRCKSQLYCLVGPQWVNKLYQALQTYGLETNIQSLQTLRFDPGLAEIFVSQHSTSQQKMPYISNPIPSVMRESYQGFDAAEDIRSRTLKLFKLLTQNQQSSNQNQNSIAQKFWSFYQSIKSYSEMVNIKITSRSKYTHKRKNKLSKESKKKIVSLQNKKKQLISNKKVIPEEEVDSNEMIEESLECIKNQIKEFFIEENQSKGLNPQQNTASKPKQLKVKPVMITSFKKQSLFEGCLIFCSDEDSCRLWRILSKLNVKVIGLQQMRHIRLEAQSLSFPEDYEETQSFKKYVKELAEKEFLRMKRRPPSKRPNFLKIHSPNPFSMIQEPIIKDSIRVFVEIVSRGRCFSNSYIYELSAQDIGLIENQMNQKGKVGIVLSETTMNQFTGVSQPMEKKFFDYSKQNLSALQEKLSLLPTKRKLIGRVTTGGYMFVKSKEGGVAYVQKSIGQEIQTLKNEGYVLVRKVTSPHYYLGQISKIFPSLRK